MKTIDVHLAVALAEQTPQGKELRSRKRDLQNAEYAYESIRNNNCSCDCDNCDNASQEKEYQAYRSCKKAGEAWREAYDAFNAVRDGYIGKRFEIHGD